MWRDGFAQIAGTVGIGVTQVLHHAANADGLVLGSGKSTDANSTESALCYLLPGSNRLSSFNSDFKKYLPAFIFYINKIWP